MSYPVESSSLPLAADASPGRRQPSRALKPPISTVAYDFGARVRRQRQQQGLSQERLADLAGLHWTFVGQVERGRRNLTLHNIVKLAAALGVDPGELMSGLTNAADIP